MSHPLQVPFFRPHICEAAIAEVENCLRSGWLTTGPLTARFESEFAAAVGAQHALAVNSCTAALHLAIEALGLKAGQAVLVPSMTFAATAEVVRYQGAVPILVDCDPTHCFIDLADAARKIADLRAGRLGPAIATDLEVVGIMPVQFGGLMADIDAIKRFAKLHGLWIVEDAAHCFPAAWRPDDRSPWQRCGEGTAAVTCFSFYANKTMTTGEGGMAVTNDACLADRMRSMSLHGLSHDAWERYSGGRNWDYRIVAPGFKYNLTDIASALGVHELQNADTARQQREQIAQAYTAALEELPELELPTTLPNRISAWHLYPLRLRLDRLSIDRNEFVHRLKSAGVGCSVHWRPLHLHPYYEEQFGWRPEQLPQMSREWLRRVSLPLFPGLRPEEFQHVVSTVRSICRETAKSRWVASALPN